MGLAGRKQKQRIPVDPRNLTWADDASRFGLAYLSKFGWDASRGLGSSGEGTTTHLKVQQNLDRMGIGAQHRRDPNGIAWKQNQEFEALLRRLNASAEQDEREGVRDDGDERERNPKAATSTPGKWITFTRARSTLLEMEIVEDTKSESGSTVTTHKRKHCRDEDKNVRDTKENAKSKKRKKEKREEPSSEDSSACSEPPPLASSSSSPSSESIPRARPMAHRARIRAAKRIADKSASAISEILGIAPSSIAPTPAFTPSSSSTPVPYAGREEL